MSYSGQRKQNSKRQSTGLNKFSGSDLKSVSGQGVFKGHPYAWETMHYQSQHRGAMKTQGTMKWVRVEPGLESKQAVGQMAALLIAQQIQEKPKSVFIFPTGNTPKPMYASLRGMQDLSWRQTTLFHLDEYVQKPELGLRQEQTFKAYLNKELWEATPSISQARRYYLQDYLHDPASYEAKIDSYGGVDVVVLGIGGNGHIAFIEPGFNPDVARHIHTVKLADKTLNDNFPDRKSETNPNGDGYTDEAVTLGLKTIMAARHVILLATGESKRDILNKAFGDFSAPPTPDIPASYLKIHPHVTVITDVTP